MTSHDKSATDYKQLISLHGKTVCVTGGLGLIGREICRAAGQFGARVLVLDIDENQGKLFQEELKAEGIDSQFIEFNITDTNGMKAKIHEIFEKEMNIAGWVNCAYPRTKDWGDKLENIKPESWTKNVRDHMDSYCLITRDVAEQMKQRRIKGSIVNLGSIYGLSGPDFSVYKGTDMTMPAAYSAIKAGIINFSRYAAQYYGPAGIRVNALCPGGIFNNQPPKFVKQYNSKVALGRMGTAQEIASCVLFLLSDASKYMTGTEFIVDGGWTSR
ncbi:SDR family oxidoreductase [Candidatus Woesearchaeota archaeon]|nr:SDR family oxidoreductase [Candidatus Woesearchaeota archaeon]